MVTILLEPYGKYFWVYHLSPESISSPIDTHIFAEPTQTGSTNKQRRGETSARQQ